MHQVKCSQCGQAFEVETLIDWKYAEWCNKCIKRANRGSNGCNGFTEAEQELTNSKLKRVGV